MILFICTSCYFAARVLEDSSGLLKGPWERQTCPRCEGVSLVCSRESDVDPALLAKMRIHDITNVECYGMLHGDGLPEDGLATPSDVRAVLLEKRIVQAGLEAIPGTTRTVITHLVFDDGTRMYLAAGPPGAIVYRLARRERP